MNENKRGQIGIILFFGFLFIIVIIGFIASIVVGVGSYANDQIQPIISEIGVVGNTNVTTAAEYTISPINTLIGALPWLVGFAYVVALIASVAFVISFESNPNPIFIGIYLFFVLLLIFGAIIMSNMYQDIFTSNDILGTQLHEQTLLSYMILYSPFILSLIAFVTGIFLFAKPRESAGGFGI